MLKFDSKFPALAIRLLAKFGAPSSISRKAGGTFVPSARSRTTGSDPTAITKKAVPPTVQAITDEQGRQLNALTSYVTPDDIGDLKLLDTFTFDGQTYKIAQTARIYSGEKVALIRLILE